MVVMVVCCWIGSRAGNILMRIQVVQGKVLSTVASTKGRVVVMVSSQPRIMLVGRSSRSSSTDHAAYFAGPNMRKRDGTSSSS